MPICSSQLRALTIVAAVTAAGGAPLAPAQSSQPSTAAPIAETTKIEPELIYRMASLTPVPESVYHDDNHTDFADQIYVILRFSRTYDYVHEVVVEPAFRTIRNNPASWDKDHVVEQAYVDSAVTPWLSLTAGKKVEFEGSGLFVNPSDLLNENKDLFDPLYQKEGVVFARMRARLGDYSLGLGFIPERGLPARSGRPWMTLSGQVQEVDLRLSATHQEAEKTTVGFSAQRFFGGAFELHTDARYQARQREQRSGNVGPTAYSAYSGDDPASTADDDASAFYVVGSRYVFSYQRTAIFEYITNQSGLLPEEFAPYFAELRRKQEDSDKVVQPPTHTLGRHYAFLAYQEDGGAKSLKLSANALRNLDDDSSFVALSARYHLSPISSVELAPTFFVGKTSTEFGEMPFSQATYLIFRGRF